MRKILILLLLLSFSVSAFKITSHIATANDVMDELFSSDKSQSVSQLTFTSSGEEFHIAVSYAYAYEAIRNHPEFFRAGVVGPDGFPDAINGQIYEHSNESSAAKSMVNFATDGDVTIDDKNAMDVMESRSWPSQLRSIDWAMKLYEHWKSYPNFTGDQEAEALAFILGYISHCIGDAFMHTWVNENAHGAWEYLEGDGIYGPLSEEVKHVAIEGYADKFVPLDRFSSNPQASTIEYDRSSLRADLSHHSGHIIYAA